jgi:hypothetical protein
VALKSLGATGEIAGPTLRAADPVVIKTRDLAQSGASPTTKLAKFLSSTKETRGWNFLVDLIYNGAASTNGFDKYGHFLRSFVTLTNCVEYEIKESSSCSAKFTGLNAGTSAISTTELARILEEEEAGEGGGTLARPSTQSTAVAPSTQSSPSASAPSLGEGRRLGAKTTATAPRQRALLDYLLGP